MRILHTGDWHLGKTLEGYSRIEEQALFVDELEEICEKEQVDVIFIAGDIYDNPNPSAEAEKLFYRAVKRLSGGGTRPIVVIAGNHDSPNRITTSRPLAEEFGIILVGTLKNRVFEGQYNGFSINKSGEGFFELEKNGEKLIVIALPYPSEKNLNEVISENMEENTFQKCYSDKIKDILHEKSLKFREDTINTVIGHFFIDGGEECGSERKIQLGGSYSVFGNIFPKKAQYVAMGHLHRLQKIKTTAEAAYYSGSPIQYSKSEANQQKYVMLADIRPGEKAKVTKLALKNHKPIEIWKADGIEEALLMCEQRKDEDSWVFLEVKTDRVFMQSEIKQMHLLKKGIVEIQPIFKSIEREEYYETQDKTLEEQFKSFYYTCKNIEPTDELVELFLKLTEEEEEVYEGEADKA